MAGETRGVLTDIAFSRYAHDRIADRRVDDAWLEEVWSSPSTRVLVIPGTRVPVVDGTVVWCAPAEAPEGTRVLLGQHDGVIHVAVLVAADRAQPHHLPIRDALPALGGDAELVVHAVGMAEWHWATRFCPRCGGDLASTHQGHVLKCVQCQREHFPRTDPAVIMLITRGEGDQECALLGRRPGWPAGRYSTLAGFVEPGESLEHAVRREVWEEAGVAVGEVRYVGSQPWPLPSSLMLGYYGTALTEEISVDGEELEEARWFTRDQLRAGAEDGSVVFPPGVSISRTLIATWFGEELPGSW